MRIPQKFKEFEGPALIIVAAKRQAQIYFARERELEVIDEIRAEPPRYSDREGFFGKRMGGKFLGSGAVYEHRKEKMEHEFVPIFIKAIKKNVANTRVRDIYLFIPAYQLQFVEPALPKSIHDKIRAVIKTNLYGRHPTVILEKLQKHLQKPAAKPEKSAVLRILNTRTLRPLSSA